MNEIWVSACLVATVAAAGLGAGCALAGLRMPGHAMVAAPAMVVMAVSCADMVFPDMRLLAPLPWAALLVGSALLALLDRAHRGAAAHHAASLLLMAVMWAAMLPTSATSATSAMWATSGATANAAAAGTATAAGSVAVGPAAGSDPHAGHELAFTDGGLLLAGLMALVVAASVALAAGAVRSARRPAEEGAAPALQLESAQHLSMAVAMASMAAGMFLPLVSG